MIGTLEVRINDASHAVVVAKPINSLGSSEVQGDSPLWRWRSVGVGDCHRHPGK
ncbi:MAG: hypothetical protein ACK43N_18800 [Pirellulaceae bacterium]